MLQYKIFTINMLSNNDEELNQFLRSHKVIEVEKHLLQMKDSAYWTFCVHYINNVPMTAQTMIKREKIDFKNVLNEDDFKKFTQLRMIRKQLAEEDAVPAYAIFTDAELAEISKLDELNVNNLETVEGIGKKKIEKYGQLLVKLFDCHINNTSTIINNTQPIDDE